MRTSLYIDTQVINYLRKNNFKNVSILSDIISKHSDEYDLYYSSAHLGDYLRDDTDYKNYDLNFMNEIGINNYLSYNEKTRMSVVVKRAPIDAFYNGKMTEKHYNYSYNENTKPRIDGILKDLFEWYKPVLFKFESNPLSINDLDIKSIEIFNALSKQVNMSSYDLTLDNFIIKMDQHWQENIGTMSDKEANKFTLDIKYLEGRLASYNNQKFDLSMANLTNQINGTQFQRDFLQDMQMVMSKMGMNYADDFDELSFFTFAYGFLEMSGIEKDKPKKFNIRSSKNDAGHFYFASHCDILITEDDGLYRKSKVLYGILGVNTFVYNIHEFIAYCTNEDQQI